MKKGFYCKLALSNIRKNAKTYIPYILTCIGCVMTFYIILAMSLDPQLQTISGGTVTAGYLYAGVTIIAIFSLIFLFYTNSFLMKRRKKEFGIYHVLGMGKRHIMKCVSLETLFVSGIGIVAGIAFGVVFARLMMLLMLRLLAIEAVFSMTFSPTAAVVTTFVFGCIFLLNLLANMIKIGRN
ncbi:MAG: ABC transporter permease, partial [Oscillospiraceae bacterium]